MFFYIPGILALIVAILVAFLVIPRMAPTLLAITAILLLAFGLYHHYTLFASEYRLSTWQEGLKFWAGPIMIGLLVLTILGYFLIFLGGGPKNNAAPVNVPLPSPNTATNPITAAINNAINASKDVVENVKEGVNNVVNFNKPRNNRNMGAVNAPRPNQNLSRSFFEKV